MDPLKDTSEGHALTRDGSSQHGRSRSLPVDGRDHHAVLRLGDEPGQVQGGDRTTDLHLAQTGVSISPWTRQMSARVTCLSPHRKSEEAVAGRFIERAGDGAELLGLLHTDNRRTNVPSCGRKNILQQEFKARAAFK